MIEYYCICFIFQAEQEHNQVYFRFVSRTGIASFIAQRLL